MDQGKIQKSFICQKYNKILSSPNHNGLALNFACDKNAEQLIIRLQMQYSLLSF